MRETPWTSDDNASAALYLGEGMVLGGGTFSFELVDGAGTRFNANYCGLGGRAGLAYLLTRLT